MCLMLCIQLTISTVIEIHSVHPKYPAFSLQDNECLCTNCTSIFSATTFNYRIAKLCTNTYFVYEGEQVMLPFHITQNIQKENY